MESNPALTAALWIALVAAAAVILFKAWQAYHHAKVVRRIELTDNNDLLDEDDLVLGVQITE